MPASRGPATSPGGTSRPGLQVPDDTIPDLDDVDFDASKGDAEAEAAGQSSGSGSGSQDQEQDDQMGETRRWEEHDVSPVNVSPKYDVDEEEFRNVWGHDEPAARQKHL